ncbi:MAG: ABC transporter ATP-binding protein [Candidatus Sedimenticola sp. (ex Thyasira tokunagai)]
MKNLIKILWDNLTHHNKRKLYVVLVATVISALSELLSIGMIIPFITIIAAPERLMDIFIVSELVDYYEIKSISDLVLPILIVFVLVNLLSMMVRILSIKLSASFAFLLGNELSVKAYDNVMHRGYIESININSSEDVSRLVPKMNSMIQSLIFPLIMLIAAAIMFFIISVVFLLVNFQLTLIIMGGLIVIYLSITKYFKKRLKENSNQISRLQNRQVRIAQESLGGIKDVILSNSYEYFLSLYRKNDKRLRMVQASNIIIAQSPRYYVETFSIIFISVLSTYLIFLSESISNDMALPIFITVAVGLQRMLPIAQQAYRSWANIEGNKQSLMDVAGLLRVPDEDNNEGLEVGNNYTSIDFKNNIILDGVYFRHKGNEHTLKEIDLTIAKGEKIGFIGGTGSGKSTLVDIIMGMLRPDRGAVYIDGKLLTDENSPAWHSHIAHVPQVVYILDDNFYHNIAFGTEGEKIDRKRVEWAANLACIDEFIGQKNNGYFEFLGERGENLSGGQKQRIGIARCLYKDSSLIVLDEATSALDSETQQRVMRNIFELSDEHTILVIAHRLNTLQGCDKIVMLENGNIKYIGTYDEIINQKNFD